MAEALDDFKKRWATIEKKADAAAEDVKRSERAMGQTSGIVTEGIKEIGLAVQDAKDAGVEGTVLKDFLKQAEVKKCYDSVVKYLGQIGDELKKMKAKKKDFTAIYGDFTKLRNDMKAEVAKRDKAVSTKVGAGNKSLPEMKKLLAELEKLNNNQSTLTLISGYEPEEFAAHLKQFEQDVAKQVASTKEAKLSGFQAMMMEGALNPRVLVGNVNRAKGWMDAALKECSAAATALDKRDQKALMTAKANVRTPLKELSDMADTYRKALADQWLKSFISTSKDKDKITKGANGVIAMYTKASAEVKKIANARIDA